MEIFGEHLIKVYEEDVPKNGELTISGIKHIGRMALAYLVGLKKLTIAEGVEDMADFACYGCENLTEVSLPSSLSSMGIRENSYKIDVNPFARCDKLSKIKVNEGGSVYTSRNKKGKECNCIINSEEEALVVGCNRTTIPDDGSVKTIKELAFCGCDKLKNITIPKSVTTIEDGAFTNCLSLELVSAKPETNFGEFPFVNCADDAKIVDATSQTLGE